MATQKAAPKPTTATQWKKQAQGVPVEVPSGNTALVRNVGMQVFLKQGIVPNSLMAIVKQAISGKKIELNVEEITEQQLSDMVDLFDAVTLYVVVEPKVYPAPAQDEERESGKLYVDEVDFEDKQFIFQWAVGGTRDLEKFREEQGAVMESVRGVSTVENTS